MCSKIRVIDLISSSSSSSSSDNESNYSDVLCDNDQISDVEDIIVAHKHTVHKLTYHQFNIKEIVQIRSLLLCWYHQNRRKLPWRGDLPPYNIKFDHHKINKKQKLEKVNAYYVWISEIMLQQTQVTTVIEYYLRFLKTFPTINDLANASIEQVNELWAGLGYYRRARYLHSGAIKVVNDYNSVLPQDVKELMKIPGIGRYTAGAIASIAYNKVAPIVDGNVIRVLSRIRAVLASSNDKKAINLYWNLAKQLVDKSEPGDFNQAMMELGSQICTPKDPKCNICPIQLCCNSYIESKQNKRPIENMLYDNKNNDKVSLWCDICDKEEEKILNTYNVKNYPLPKKKKPRKIEHLAVCVIMTKNQDNINYLLIQRPSKGLLASQWQYPTVALQNNKKYEDYIYRKQCMNDHLQNIGLTIKTTDIIKRFDIENEVIIHDFTHIRHYMYVEIIHICRDHTLQVGQFKWYNDSNMNSKMTTGVLKVRQLVLKQVC